jgi:hypothetical protein
VPHARLAVCLAFALALAGCGSDAKTPSDRSLISTPTSSDTTPAPTSPGAQTTPGDATAATSPAGAKTTTPADDGADPLAHAPTIPGTARVVLSGGGGSHTYAVRCAKIDVAPLFATANIALKPTMGGSFDSYLVPRRDTDTFLYLVDDTADAPSIVGKTSTFTDATTTPVGVQGAFDGKIFGGATDLLERAKVTVSDDARKGELAWEQTDGTGFTVTWSCG